MAAVSCQKSELTAQNGSGDEVTVNISAVMQSDNATTRAIDANGKASQINRCIMEIYTQEGEFYQRQMADVETDLTADFTINLVPEKTYDFVFWADHSEDGESDYHYTTTSLKEITAVYTEYDGNDESRDAFFATVNQTITASESNVEAKLYRPFGQVNVSTYVKDLIESYLPTTVQVEYTSNNIATTFNAFDGTTDGSTDFAWQDAATVIETVAVGETLYHLSTDYIFAPKEGQALIDFKMEFFNDGASIMTNDKFTSIPVQRNYRTNISGNLLTIGSDITVEVVPTFNEPAIEVEVTTVETVEEVANVLAVVQSGDDANVTVTGTVTGNDNHIEVPAAVEGTTGETSITVNFEDVDATAEISFGGTNKGDESSYDGTVYITAPEGVTLDDLSINLPNAHIVFNGVAQDVDEASADGTFVIAEGASVVNLTVNAGNVAVYGTVTTIAQGDGNDGITEVTIYTQGKGVDHASEMVGNLTALQANNDFIVTILDNNNIQNATTGKYYPSIQDAATAAKDGETIELASGTYAEDVELVSDVTICAKAGNDVTIDGQITATLQALTLKDLTLVNSEGHGIYSDEGGDIIVDNVTFNVTGESKSAISFWNNGDKTPSTLSVTNSTFDCEKTRPIQIRNTESALVENCTFNDPYSYAVQLDVENNNLTFKNNTISNCQMGVFVYENTVSSSVTVSNNTFNSVYFEYAAEPEALNNETNTFGDEFAYYLQSGKSTTTDNGFTAIQNKPYKTVILAGSFDSQIALTSANNHQTFIALNANIDPTVDADKIKDSWKITGAVKFGYDTGNKVLEGITLRGLYLENTFVNQQFGGLEDVTIENCIFNGTANNWSCGYIVHQGSHAGTTGYTIKNNLFKVTEETTSPRLMIWGGKNGYDMKDILIENNVMEAGYLHFDGYSGENVDITISNNNITVPDTYMYASMIAGVNSAAKFQFNNNTFNNGYFCGLYLYSGDITLGGNLLMNGNTFNNTPNEYAAKGTCIDSGELVCSGFDNLAVYYTPTATVDGVEYSTIQAALDVAAEGATITLNGATFDEDITFKQNGITLMGANAGVSGLSENRNPESIILGDINLSANNIVIDGIRMTGASTRVAKLQGNNIDGLTFKNSVVDNISKNFIYYGDSEAVFNRNILIENNKIMDSNTSSCSNIYICNPIDLTISGNYIANSNWGGMIISGSGYGENVSIVNNTFADHNVRYDLMLSGLFKTAVTISGNTFNHSSSYCALYLYLQQDTPTSAVHNINDNTFNSNTCISMGAWDSNSEKATYDADNFKMNGNTFNISKSSPVVLRTEDRFVNYNGYIQFLNNKIYEDGDDNFSWDSAFVSGGPFSITESSQLQVDTNIFLPEW